MSKSITIDYISMHLSRCFQLIIWADRPIREKKQGNKRFLQNTRHKYSDACRSQWYFFWCSICHRFFDCCNIIFSFSKLVKFIFMTFYFGDGITNSNEVFSRFSTKIFFHSTRWEKTSFLGIFVCIFGIECHHNFSIWREKEIEFLWFVTDMTNSIFFMSETPLPIVCVFVYIVDGRKVYCHLINFKLN